MTSTIQWESLCLESAQPLDAVAVHTNSCSQHLNALALSGYEEDRAHVILPVSSNEHGEGQKGESCNVRQPQNIGTLGIKAILALSVTLLKQKRDVLYDRTSTSCRGSNGAPQSACSIKDRSQVGILFLSPWRNGIKCLLKHDKPIWLTLSVEWALPFSN